MEDFLFNLLLRVHLFSSACPFFASVSIFIAILLLVSLTFLFCPLSLRISPQPPHLNSFVFLVFRSLSFIVMRSDTES